MSSVSRRPNVFAAYGFLCSAIGAALIGGDSKGSEKQTGADRNGAQRAAAAIQAPPSGSRRQRATTPSKAQPQAKTAAKAPDAAAVRPLTFRLPSAFVPTSMLRISEAPLGIAYMRSLARDPDHKDVLRLALESRGGGDLAVRPGWYFLLARNKPMQLDSSTYLPLEILPIRERFDGAKLLRVQVLEATFNGAKVRVSPEAIEVFRNKELWLVEPVDAAEADFEQLPDVIPLRLELPELEPAQRLLIERFSAIGKAISLTPNLIPVIYGPDGKRWHSWRVLLLPALGDDLWKLYQDYDLGQPWDSEHNRRLLDRMPDVYRDPIDGQPGDSNTSVAIFTGDEGLMGSHNETLKDDKQVRQFAKERALLGPLRSPYSDYPAGTRYSGVAGYVGAKAGIPWTKPEDVRVPDDFPPLGRPKGIAAPFRIGERRAGLLLFADGRPDLVDADAPLDVLRPLVSRPPSDARGNVPKAELERLAKARGQAARLSPYPQGDWLLNIVQEADGPVGVVKAAPDAQPEAEQVTRSSAATNKRAKTAPRAADALWFRLPTGIMNAKGGINDPSVVMAVLAKREASGDVRLAAMRDRAEAPKFKPGWYLALCLPGRTNASNFFDPTVSARQEPDGSSAANSLKERFRGASLVRVQLLDSPNDWSAKVAPEAAAFLAGTRIFLFRPAGASDEQIRQAPAVARLQVDADSPPSPADLAIERMQQIAKAFEACYVAHWSYPSAVVKGPDGKPWHSWRALLLPFLSGQEELAKQYDLSQSWDSEQNRPLLMKMPDVYADPFSEGADGTSTNIMVIIGEQAAFPPAGCKLDDAEAVNAFAKRPMEFCRPSTTLSYARLRDGASNTVIMAAAERHVPWTQPIDLGFPDDLPPRGGIAFRDRPGGQAAALLQFADMRTVFLPDSADHELVRAMYTANGKDVVVHDPSPATAISVSPWSIRIDSKGASIARGGP